MPDEYVPQPDPPIDDGTPILFKPGTFARHDRALSSVLSNTQARYPRPKRGRTTHPATGAWGYLESGATISAASGLVLGSGTVKLCSRGGTGLSPGEETVTVYNSGSEITGPLILELDWTDGDWAVCVCPSTPTEPGSCCWPVKIPEVDLTFAWESSFGNGSATMVYDSFDTLWQTGCTGPTNRDIFTLSCAAGLMIWDWSLWNSNDDCESQTGFPIANCEVPLELVSISGSPFKLELTNMHDWCGHAAESDGYSKWTITGPSTTDAGCCIPFETTGCNGLPLGNSGITVKSGSTTIASGTSSTLTATLGQVAIDAGVGGTYDVTVTNSPRFSSATFTGISLACNTMTTLDMSGHVGTGFHCLAGCAQPVKNTLHVTFSTAGAQTLTFASGVWSSSFTASGHAYIVTLHQDGSMTITRDGTDCGTVTLVVTSCPPSFAGSIGIAAGACATELGSTGTITE